MELNKISEIIKTEDRIELPLYFSPPLCYTLYGAVRLSIILSNPVTHDWFYSNFIQLHFAKKKQQRFVS